MLERAIKRTSAKNATAKASSTPHDKSATKKPYKGNSELSPFTVLTGSSPSHLLNVAQDSCKVFSSTAGSPRSLISVIQAREVAQAELACARLKVEQDLAAAKAKEADKNPHPGKVGDSSQEGPEMLATMTSSSSVAREAPVKRKRMPKVIPVGHRPVTRQARALSRVA
jgi:hypothetical protein